MQTLVKVIAAVSQQIEALAVFFKDGDVVFLTQVRGQLQHLVDSFLFARYCLVVAVLDPLFKAGHLKDVPRVRLILFVLVSRDSQ